MVEMIHSSFVSSALKVIVEMHQVAPLCLHTQSPHPLQALLGPRQDACCCFFNKRYKNRELIYTQLYGSMLIAMLTCIGNRP